MNPMNSALQGSTHSRDRSLASATSHQLIQESYRQSQVIQLKDGQACFVRKGSGQPVILLHGIPLCLITWRFNFQQLSQGMDVIALDMKGFGRSGNSRGDYSPAGHAEFLLQFIDYLGLQRVSLVGSSYACAVAMSLAVRHPDRVRRLVFINSVGYPSKSHSLEQLVRIKGIRTVLKHTLRSRLVGRRALDSGLHRSYADPHIASPELVDSYFDILRAGPHEESFLATLEAFHEDEIEALIPKLQHETMLIWGAQDHVLPVGNVWLFKRDLPKARLEIIDQAGHLPHEEAPDVVNAAITKFVAESDTLDETSKASAAAPGVPA